MKCLTLISGKIDGFRWRVRLLTRDNGTIGARGQIVSEDDLTRKRYPEDLHRSIYHDIFAGQGMQGEINMKMKPYEGWLRKGTPESAGYDVGPIDSLICVAPSETFKIELNIRFSEGLPHPALLILRSSYQDKGLIQPSVGLIDKDYTENLFLTVYNTSKAAIWIERGERIAQLIFINAEQPYLIEPLRGER